MHAAGRTLTSAFTSARAAAWLVVALAMTSGAPAAAEETTLPDVVVSASRNEQRRFDAPAAKIGRAHV